MATTVAERPAVAWVSQRVAADVLGCNPERIRQLAESGHKTEYRVRPWE